MRAAMRSIDQSTASRTIAAGGASGALCAIAYPPNSVVLLSLVALVPWLLCLWRAGPLVGAASGLAFGMVLGLWVSRWIPHSMVLLESSLASGVAIQALCAFLFSGVPMACAGAAIATAPRTRWLASASVVALVFLLLDMARSHVPGLVPWALVGHTQVDSGLAQLAAIGGVPLVSAVVAAANGALAELVRNPRERGPLLLVSAGLACAAFGTPVVNAVSGDSSGDSLEVLVVQPNLPAGERRSDRVQRTNLRFVADQTRRVVDAAAEAPDVVVWPEQILTSPVDLDPELSSALTSFVDELGVPLVAGITMSAQGERSDVRRGTTAWIEPGRGIVATSDKVRAIPVVESSASFAIVEWVRRIAGPAGVKGVRIQEAERATALAGEVELVVPACFEVQFPGVVDQARTAESFAIVNLSNDSWMESEALARMQIAFARFRAIEQRLYLVRAAHGGVSAVIDPFGAIVDELPFDSTGSLSARIARGVGRPVRELIALLGLSGLGALVGWFGSMLFWRYIR